MAGKLIHTVLDQLNPAQILIGSVVVVAMQSFLRRFSDLLQKLEGIAVQHLGAICPIESLQIVVPRRFTRLDVVQGISIVLCSLKQCIGNQLETVFYLI